MFRMFQYLRDGFFVDARTSAVVFRAVFVNRAARAAASWQLRLIRLPAGAFVSYTTLKTLPELSAGAGPTAAFAWDCVVVALACVHAIACAMLRRHPGSAPCQSTGPTSIARRRALGPSGSGGGSDSCSDAASSVADSATPEAHPGSESARSQEHSSGNVWMTLSTCVVAVVSVAVLVQYALVRRSLSAHLQSAYNSAAAGPSLDAAQSYQDLTAPARMLLPARQAYAIAGTAGSQPSELGTCALVSGAAQVNSLTGLKVTDRASQLPVWARPADPSSFASFVAMQDAAFASAASSSRLHTCTIMSFVLVGLHALAVMRELPAMAVIYKALMRTLPQLLTLGFVFAVILAPSAIILYASAPINERLTRVDLLASYMFGGILTGASFCRLLVPPGLHMFREQCSTQCVSHSVIRSTVRLRACKRRAEVLRNAAINVNPACCCRLVWQCRQRSQPCEFGAGRAAGCHRDGAAVRLPSGVQHHGHQLCAGCPNPRLRRCPCRP